MKTNVRRFAHTLAVALAVMFVVGRISGQQDQGRSQDRGQQDQNAGKGEIGLPPLQPVCNLLPPGGVCFELDNAKVELLHVQGNVYMIAGAGANITVQVGDEFVMLVDTGVPEMSNTVIAAIRALTDKPIFLIVATSSGTMPACKNEGFWPS